MKNKLTVFWIEDNPIQFNVERKNRKQYPKFLHEEFITYCLFQHPKQVEEYLSMISVLKGETPVLAAKCQNALPDIVVFDYKMADAFNNNPNALSYYDNDHNAYLQSNSASHKLKETFEEQFKNQTLFLDREDVKGLEYGRDKFKDEFKAAEIQLDDEFGLYCGITIVREFKEYITVGVPATINKADKTKTMSYNSLFYEWINSYDLKGTIGRPANVNEMKDWSKILEFTTDLLRKRIVIQVESDKIQLDLQQLIDLNSGTFPAYGETNDEKRVFTFTSIYGTRHLPLDGLFIDKNEGAERDKAIEEWAGELLDTWSKKTGFKFEEYEKASEISKNLIRAYRSGNIEKRHTLSELITKEVNGNLKSKEEKTQLVDLMNYFGIDNTNIDGVKNRKNAKGKSKYNKIKKHFTDIDTETTGLREEIIKLVIYFSDIQLHLLYQNFIKKAHLNESYKGDFSNYLYTKPKFEFLEAVLFPVPESPLVLPYHLNYLNDIDDSEEKHIKDNWNSFFNLVRSKDMPYGEMMTLGEKSVCKNFAISLGLEPKNYPVWLNK